MNPNDWYIFSIWERIYLRFDKTIGEKSRVPLGIDGFCINEGTNLIDLK
jgi:hypothetical protein